MWDAKIRVAHKLIPHVDANALIFDIKGIQIKSQKPVECQIRKPSGNGFEDVAFFVIHSAEKHLLQTTQYI